ncbi:MAG: hypothetical protein K2M69_07630 [Muribaculaceae bacterium]|nr:hypothetical protein [Muribaculaceae bacterium]
MKKLLILVAMGHLSFIGHAFSHDTDTISNNSSQIEQTADTVSTSAYDLQEVVVKSENVVRKGNLVELFPGKRDKRFAAGGKDVLANMHIPDISVDPLSGTVTSSDGLPVSMFIDFQPASAQQVRDIRPQDIMRIDLIRSPEDPRFQGAKIVANFIMRKYEYGGYTKVDATQYLPAFSSNLGLYSKFSYKKMTYDVSTGLGFTNLGDHSGSDSRSEYQFGSVELERISRTFGSKSRQLSPRVSARAIYNSKGVSISNMVGFNYSRLKPSERKGSVDFSDIFDSSQSTETRTRYSRGIVWNSNLYFQLPDGWSLNAGAGFDWTDNRDNSAYALLGYAPIVNLITEEILNANGRVSLRKRFGDHSLNLLGAGGWNRNKLDYLSSDNTAVHHREGYGQLGATLNLDFNGFMFNPSVRLSLSSERVNESTYTRWLPKCYAPFYVQLTRRSSISGSFEFAYEGPQASMLSPVTVRNNEVDAVRGNENLKSTPNYFTRLGYSNFFGQWLSLNIEARYHRVDNLMVPLYTPGESEDGLPMMIRDVYNNGSLGITTLTASMSGNYFDNRLSASLSGSANYYTQHGDTRRVKWYPSAWVSASWYVGNFRINGYFNPSEKQYTAWNDLTTSLYWYLGATYSYRDLYLELRFNNPFTRSYVRYKESVDGGPYKYSGTTYSPYYHQNVCLTLSYSIGYGKKVDRRDEVGEMQGAASIILKK